jgi:hypothetical protein
MMEIIKINEAAGKLIGYLSEQDLKPDEKIAVLETVAATIKTVLSTETFSIMIGRIVSGGKI